MSMSGTSCPKCGAASQNPSATSCVYCGTQLPPPQPAGGYGAAPGGYGAPPAPYGAPPAPYGAPSPYGSPPSPYGGPQPPQGYGGPQPPVFHSGPPVHTFGQPYHQQNGFMSAVSGFGNAMFWIRLAVAVVVLSVVALGSCINALTHGY